ARTMAAKASSCAVSTRVVLARDRAVMVRRDVVPRAEPEGTSTRAMTVVEPPLAATAPVMPGSANESYGRPSPSGSARSVTGQPFEDAAASEYESLMPLALVMRWGK